MVPLVASPMNEFFKFMATRWGRLLRLSLGMILFAYGIGHLNFWGVLAAGLGGLAMFAGATDLCLIAPFWNLPITGKMLRRHYGIHEPKLDWEK